MAAEVTKANTDRDAWKQIAVGTIGHVHTAVAKARAEARHAEMRAGSPDVKAMRCMAWACRYDKGDAGGYARKILGHDFGEGRSEHDE